LFDNPCWLEKLVATSFISHNWGMATSATPLIDSILSLPQTQRAELAVQILQSLELPGEEISSEVFGQELRSRVEKYRNGEMESVSLKEAREILTKRISAGPSNWSPESFPRQLNRLPMQPSGSIRSLLAWGINFGNCSIMPCYKFKQILTVSPKVILLLPISTSATPTWIASDISFTSWLSQMKLWSSPFPMPRGNPVIGFQEWNLESKSARNGNR